MNKFSKNSNTNNGDNMQKINCKVHDCKYCNCDKDVCELKEITVTNCTHGQTPKELTICDSYKARKSI